MSGEKLTQTCANCGVVFESPNPPDHAYAAVYEYDKNGEPLIGVHCDECGENLGLPRIDLDAERKKELQ